MPGPIGFAIATTLRSVACPHCGHRQARAATGKLTCKYCRRTFTPPTEATKAKAKPRKR